MSLRVSTTGSDVPLNDLGIIVVHPTVYRDLSLEFTALELKESEDLTEAIQNGDLVVDDGTFSIHADDYDPDQLLIEQLDFWRDRNIISADEMASCGTTCVCSGVFPLALNSTATATKNVYANGGRWITWWVDADDKIEITGCAAAGTYTIDSVTDQQNLVVKESIVDSTGGQISILHPPGASRIGIDPTNIDWTDATDLQSALEELDITASGINEPEHRELDQLVHEISEDSYEEYTYTPGGMVTSIIVWTNQSKTTKIREERFTYTGIHVTSVTTIQYGESGEEVERMVETYNRLGENVISISRSVTL